MELVQSFTLEPFLEMEKLILGALVPIMDRHPPVETDRRSIRIIDSMDVIDTAYAGTAALEP
jgi:hypothetical protein